MRRSTFYIKATWRLRQLLPLHYRSHYGVCLNDDCTEQERHFAVWRMWFGHVFAHDDVKVAQ